MASKSELHQPKDKNVKVSPKQKNKKQKISKSMDDEKTKDSSRETRFISSPRRQNNLPSLSPNSHSNPVNNSPRQKSNIKRSFVKNSKLAPNSYKMTQSRPEKQGNDDYLPFDNEQVLQNMILCQIEYLFSNYHLENDTYLLARMQDSKMNWLSVDEIMHNQKIRQLTGDKDKVVRALRLSKYLQLSSDYSRVRRPDFVVPKLPPNRDLRRTVFVYGIPCNKPESDLRAILNLYGVVKRIHFEKLESIDVEAPQRAIARLIMRKKFLFPPRTNYNDHGSDTESISSIGSKFSVGSIVINPNGNTDDFSHLTTCFVVYESQSQATKCVKHRVRAADGMRAIHKYDYNKVAKKYRVALMKGEKLRFSPPPPSSNNNDHHYNNYHHQRSNRSASPVSSNYRQQQQQRNHNHHNNNNNNENNSSSRPYQSYRSQPNMSSPQPVNNRFSGWNGRTSRGNYNNNNHNNNSPRCGYQNGSSHSPKQQQEPRRHRLGSRKDRSSYDNNQAVNANGNGNNNDNNNNNNNHHNNAKRVQHRGHNMGLYKSNDFTAGKTPITRQWKRSSSQSKLSQNSNRSPKDVLPQNPDTLNKSQTVSDQLPKLQNSAPQMMRSQSAKLPKAPSKQQQQSSTSPAPKLYNPIPNDKNAPKLPCQAEIEALKRAGYNHDLNFMADLNINDLNNDPLMAYNKYFGFDGQGKAVSTQQAAQSLTKQTNSVLATYSQQQSSSTYQQSTTTSTSSSTYYQQHQQQQHSYSAPRHSNTQQNVTQNHQSQQ